MRKSTEATTRIMKTVIEPGLAQNDRKSCPADPGGIHAFKLSECHFEEIQKHPAADGGVEHHQQIVSSHGSVSIQVPFGALGLQNIKGQRRDFSGWHGRQQTP